MEKIKLNNQVVRMRKHVKQAKVHSINRLVKQVKLLQNRKGNEIQVLKAKRKAEKYLQEISFLKKVRPDDVSKLALSKTKDWKEILSQKSSTLEDRCLAILANYGPVQKEVESFHNANKDIISKISDYIKHWEERKKFCNDSSWKKKSDVKALQSNVSLFKKKMTGLLNDLTNQSEASDDGTNKSPNEKVDSSLLVENSLKLEGGKGKNEVFLKHKLGSSIKSSQNSSPNKKVSNESHRNECLPKKMEIEISNEVKNKPKKLLDNDDKNQLESYIISNGDRESQIDCVNTNESESKNESRNEDSELAISPEEELKSESTLFSNTIKEVKTSADNKDHAASENSMAFCSIPLKADSKISKSSENKFKEIAVLNLDDLRDLDEIPVNNSFENSKSSEEEEEGTDDDLSNNALQNDPFFLDRDEAFSTENKLVDNPKNSNFVSLNEIFERKEKSNNCNNSKNYPKSLKQLDFSSRHSSEFKTERKFKPFKKDMLIPKYDQYKFQRSETSKNRFQPYKYKKFDKDNAKNHKEFYQKTCMETYGGNKQNNSNDLYHKNGDNSFMNSNKPQRKNDANNKPLHPSWEAKRKQKELINMSFQGKKIVFED